MSPVRRPEAGAGRYAIRVAGGLDSRWASWFDGCTVRREDDGTTLITATVPDQAALHGVLQALRDLGLPLLAVTPLDPPTSASRRRA